MWKLVKSKGLFFRDHLDVSPVTESVITDIIGRSTPDESRASHAVLAQLSARFSVENAAQTKRSSEVYLGVIDGKGVAESSSGQLGAWISITSRYVQMCSRASALAAGFDVMNLVAPGGGSQLQQLLDKSRGSAIVFLDVDGRPDLEYWRADEEVWASFDSHPTQRDETHAGIAWVVAHELTHLVLGDASSRPDLKAIEREAKLCQSSMHNHLWPPNLSHQSELIADHKAIASVRKLHNGFRPVDSLFVAMRSSIIATAVIAVDGWFEDGNTPSAEHPSPFLRSWALLGFWAAYLQRCDDADWEQDTQPTKDELLTVARTICMVEWLAGAYGTHRGGSSAMLEDLRWVHDVLCGASGLKPPFRLEIDIPPIS